MAPPATHMAGYHWRAVLLLTLAVWHSALLTSGALTNSSNTSSRDISSEELVDRSDTEGSEYSEAALWSPVYSNNLHTGPSTSHDDHFSSGGGDPLNAGVKDQREREYDENKQPIRVSKRDTSGISNWGSNPYLIGKRLSNRAFWAPRGKKFLKDFTSTPTSDKDSSIYYTREPTSYDSFGDPFNAYTPSMSYLDGDAEGDETRSALNENLRRLNLVGDAAKRRERLFWVARGKRMGPEATEDSDDSEAHPEKRGSSGLSSQLQKALWKNNGGDASKFWMSRGRRFWAARGKKSVEPATFNRLARLVNSGFGDSTYNFLDTAGQSELAPEHVLGYPDLTASAENLEQPIFWVVRGKKSKFSPADDFGASDLDDVESSLDLPSQDREKKAFNDFASALSRLKNRELKVPNFWANRGRKNFWAARGKRSLSQLND